MSRATALQVLLERYLENVKPSGAGNFRAACPFHTSSSAKRSLYVHGDTGHWTCFGCPAGGGLHKLLYRKGLTRRLVDAELNKIDLEQEDRSKASQAKLALRRRAKFVLPEHVLGLYDYCSETMLDLGFTEDTLLDHDIGFDQEKMRVTFAVRDFRGRLVAISGRADVVGVFPRYLVYEEEFEEIVPGYKGITSRHLYNFNNIYPHRYFKPELDHGPLLITEGYKACLWQIQNGRPHTCALQGSFMTREQEMLLRLLRGPYYVWLDWEPGKAFPDDRGRCAAYRIAERLSRYGRTFLVTMPPDTKEGTSPDDLTREETTDVIQNFALTRAQLAVKSSRRWSKAAPPT